MNETVQDTALLLFERKETPNQHTIVLLTMAFCVTRCMSSFSSACHATFVLEMGVRVVTRAR